MFCKQNLDFWSGFSSLCLWMQIILGKFPFWCLIYLSLVLVMYCRSWFIIDNLCWYIDRLYRDFAEDVSSVIRSVLFVWSLVSLFIRYLFLLLHIFLKTREGIRMGIKSVCTTLFQAFNPMIYRWRMAQITRFLPVLGLDGSIYAILLN